MPVTTSHSPEASSPANPWCPARVITGSTLGAAVVALCFFCPRFWLWPVAGMPLTELIAIQPEVHRAYHALQQLNDPWQRIADPTNRVMEWRLFWPVMAHASGLSKNVYFAIPYVGCLAALAGVAFVAWRATGAVRLTAAATLFAATSSWFFVSTGWLAYFDSWLLLALLAVSFAPSRWALFGAAAVAPWIDERFLLALPLCLAVRKIAANRTRAPTRRELLGDAAALIAGIAPYVAIRLGAEISGARATSQDYWNDRPLLPAPPLAIAWGAWNGLRLGWVIIAFAGLAAFRNRSHRGTILAALGAVALSLVVADDLSRSASIAVPLLIACLLAGWRYRRVQMERALPWLCLGNLVLPAQHIIASPGTSVAFHAVPVLAADAEIERAQNPPDFANPNTYVRRSTDHLQNGNRERALIAAEIAVRFGPANAKATANHGIILYTFGQQKAGAAELDRALDQAPGLFDARMQRAAFRRQAGDFHGALTDVRQALRDMPADWPRRSDAQQFERTLAAQVAR